MNSMYDLNYETRAVLGAATPKDGKPRTHAVGITTGRVFCGTVKPENLADRCATDVHALPTCPRCLVKLSCSFVTPVRGTK